MSEINYRPIGVIRTPFKEPKGTPIQPTGAEGVKGSVHLNPDARARNYLMPERVGEKSEANRAYPIGGEYVADVDIHLF